MKETLAREIGERFSSEIDLLRHEVRVRASSAIVLFHMLQIHAGKCYHTVTPQASQAQKSSF